MKTCSLKKITAIILVILLASSLTGCNPAKENEKSNPNTTDNKAALAAEFAPYNEPSVDEQPSLKAYSVAADLSNIENHQRFQFSPAAQSLLVKNGFVVLTPNYSEYYPLYETNRYDSVVPNLVTTDSMLHNYHLYFDYLLKTTEEDKLIPELKQLSQGMLEASRKQYKEAPEGEWKTAAARNLAFFSVADQLINSGTAIPAEVREEVQAELQLIKAHNQTAISPIMSMGTKKDELESLKEDYTQYIPRGHYTRSEALKSYFETMMWYGRITFRLKNDSETRSAVLMTAALNQDANLSAWNNINSVTEFFVGRNDDPGYSEYAGLLKKIYGAVPTVQDLASQTDKWSSFVKAAATLKGPSINSIPIYDANIQPDREKEIKGFRFMGQRYTLDADIFQRLVYREVGENPQGERRMLPKGLDIPAVMGSAEAQKILKDLGEEEYPNYSANMSKMQQYVSSLSADTWHQNLYWGWLNTLQPLLGTVPEGYPSFMRNQAWTRKSLSTYLGSWTELKHDTVLYAKQVYAEAGGGGDAKDDDRGYVEPNPKLYARLAALTAMTSDGLQSRGLLDKNDAENLNRLQKLSLDLKTISEKELKGQSLSDSEYELIRGYGAQLEHFWLETLKGQDQNRGSNQLLVDNPAMVVADVATDPNGTVLEEGTGFIQTIYAVVPVEGKLRIARGGVYSYYEFPWPANDRLTDDAWRELLYYDKAPAAPDWTSAFIASDGECRIIMPWELEQ
ncbi:MAG TPA: DUF3160 domain-containing protein [Syntrophomonas sp.]|nr:DUF3160 domain-containing protein [Syntrophomonas sp.]